MCVRARFLLIAAALFLLVCSATAQDEEICTDRGIIAAIDTPLVRYRVVFGRISVKRPKGEKKPLTVVVSLREGNSTQRLALDGSGSYCFAKSAAGGELTVDINGQEAARRSIITNLPQQREDFEFSLTPTQPTAPPSVVPAKFPYQRNEKNAKLFERALKADAEQKPEKAIEYLSAIVQADPADHVVHATIGSIYYRQKKYSEAEIWFKRSVAANPEFTPAWISLCQSQYAQKDYETAIESCKKVIKLDPNSAVSFYILGEAYLQTQKGNLAVDALNEAIKLDPVRMAECHLILADLYDLNGMKKLATKEYKEFLTKVPGHPEKKRLEEYIKNNPE